MSSNPDISSKLWRSLALPLGSALFFSIFINLLMLTGPIFMLLIYDRVLASRSEETLVALTLIVVALYGAMWTLDAARSWILARVGARIQLALDRPTMFSALSARGSQSTHASVRDIDVLRGFFSSPGLPALMDMPFTPLFIAAIFIFHPLLGWLAMSGGLLLAGLTALGQILSRKPLAQAQKQSEDCRTMADQMARSTEFIRAQNMDRPLIIRWESLRQVALETSMRVSDKNAGLATLTKATRLALQSLILALGAALVLSGDITAGAMIAASIMLGRALAPVEQVLARWPQIESARQSWKVIQGKTLAPQSAIKRTALPTPQTGLSVQGVTLGRGPGQPPLLYNVSFALVPGQALGVIGRSGSGKTTLARMVTGLIEPPIGEVRLGGALLSQYQQQDLGQHIGYLPQDSCLLPGTVSENIARFDPNVLDEEIIEASRAAGAHDLILSLQDGYETLIDNATDQLSGGQRQRVALARALFRSPKILVLDEPNSALDADGTNALNAAISSAKSKGTAVLLMTHRPTAITECERLLVIEEGRIRADGPRDEIIRSMMKNAGLIETTLSRGTSA